MGAVTVIVERVTAVRDRVDAADVIDVAVVIIIDAVACYL